MKGLTLAAALALAALAFALVDGDSGLLPWWQLRQEIAETRARIAGHERRNELLRGQVQALETDSFAMERAIREDLGLARRGETIVRLLAPGHPND